MSYLAHKKWRRNNRLAGLTADGLSPSRQFRTPEERRASNTALASNSRHKRFWLGLTSRNTIPVRAAGRAQRLTTQRALAAAETCAELKRSAHRRVAAMLARGIRNKEAMNHE